MTLGHTPDQIYLRNVHIKFSTKGFILRYLLVQLGPDRSNYASLCHSTQLSLTRAYKSRESLLPGRSTIVNIAFPITSWHDRYQTSRNLWLEEPLWPLGSHFLARGSFLIELQIPIDLCPSLDSVSLGKHVARNGEGIISAHNFRLITFRSE